MTTVLCIGGPLDGQRREVDPAVLREYNHVRFADRPKLPDLTQVPEKYDLNSARMLKTYDYAIMRLRFETHRGTEVVRFCYWSRDLDGPGAIVRLLDYYERRGDQHAK